MANYLYNTCRSASGSNEPDTLCIEYPISTSVAAVTKPNGEKILERGSLNRRKMLETRSLKGRISQKLRQRYSALKSYS
jgi:hypothetical protein